MKGVESMVYYMIDKYDIEEVQVDNGVPLMAGGISYVHAATYFRDVAAIRGRLYADGMEE